MNAKNQLIELLQNLGCDDDCVSFSCKLNSPPSRHQSTVVAVFPNGVEICGMGEGQRCTEADTAAAQVVLDKIKNDYPYLCIDWDKINCEAQIGDLLIKLSVYLLPDLPNTSEKSQFLQKLESDSQLAKVFDFWVSQGDPELAMWGTKLGEKRKATLVEALLWRRFGKQVIKDDVAIHFQSLLKSLRIS